VWSTCVWKCDQTLNQFQKILGLFSVHTGGDLHHTFQWQPQKDTPSTILQGGETGWWVWDHYVCCDCSYFLGLNLERHPGCQDIGICDDLFPMGLLNQVLEVVTEFKQTVKHDFDMELNVPKFFSTGNSISIETQTCIQFDHSVKCFGFGSGWHGSRGIYQQYACCWGPHWWWFVGTIFFREKTWVVITDVSKFDIISDGYIHLQVFNLF